MKSSTPSDLKKYWPSGLALRVASRANRMLDPRADDHRSNLFDFMNKDQCDFFLSNEDLPMPTEAQQPVFSLMSALIALASSSGLMHNSASSAELSNNNSSQLRASMSWV